MKHEAATLGSLLTYSAAPSSFTNIFSTNLKHNNAVALVEYSNPSVIFTNRVNSYMATGHLRICGNNVIQFVFTSFYVAVVVSESC